MANFGFQTKIDNYQDKRPTITNFCTTIDNISVCFQIKCKSSIFIKCGSATFDYISSNCFCASKRWNNEYCCDD